MKEGDYVHYVAPHGAKENGRIKRIDGDSVFVVYHCNNEWNHYKDYTGQKTDKKDLRHGWVNEKGNILPEHCDHYYIHTNAKWAPINQQRCCHCGHIIE